MAQGLSPVGATDPTFNVMLYGDPFAGKTTMAASAQDHPSMRQVAFANIEGGLMSVAHRGDIWKYDVKAMDDLERFFWKLVDPKGRYADVRTVVIDNATELQTINLEEIVTEAIARGKDKVKGQPRTKDDLWQEDYGRSTVQLKRIFRAFRDLPLNVIFTAHAKRIYPKVPPGTDLSTVEPLATLPSLTDKLGKSVMGYMDFVWYLEYDADEDTRFMLTRPQEVEGAGRIFAKTRGPRFLEALGPLVQNPDLATLYDLFTQTAQKGAVKKRRMRTQGE